MCIYRLEQCMMRIYTVKEGNFGVEYNFVQKKVFLCELLLTLLSSWRVKKIF